MLKGGADGGCFPDFFKFVKNIFAQGRGRKKYDVDLRLIFCDFSQQASSFARPTAVCPTNLRRDLLFHLLNPYHKIFAVTALHAATQPEVACRVFCVLRDEHLAIHRLVHFASPAAAGIVCFTAAIRSAATI